MRTLRFPLVSRKRHLRELQEIKNTYEAALSAVRQAYEAERRAMAVSTSLISAIKEDS